MFDSLDQPSEDLVMLGPAPPTLETENCLSLGRGGREIRLHFLDSDRDRGEGGEGWSLVDPGSVLGGLRRMGSRDSGRRGGEGQGDEGRHEKDLSHLPCLLVSGPLIANESCRRYWTLVQCHNIRLLSRFSSGQPGLADAPQVTTSRRTEPW